MTEEGKITMSEFKTVVEQFKDEQKKMIEYMDLRFNGIESDIKIIKQDVVVLKQDTFVLKQDVGTLKQDVGTLKNDMVTVKEEIGLLHEGQTAIRADLRKKVSYDDFEALEKRVTRLECKYAQ